MNRIFTTGLLVINYQWSRAVVHRFQDYHFFIWMDIPLLGVSPKLLTPVRALLH